MRRGVLVLGAMLAAVPLWPIRADAGGGGGGCGRPVTEAAGTGVAVRNFCFSPTIIRVRPGQAVVWSNKDGFEHDVVGANFSWGASQTLPAGETVRYKFSKPGVYPYVCTWHPGMVGAVVVGGSGLEGVRKLDPQSVEAILANLPTQQALRPVTASASGGQPHQASSGVWTAVAITLIALFVTIAVAAAGVTIRQNRERRNLTENGIE
jgi:plastocyanin